MARRGDSGQAGEDSPFSFSSDAVQAPGQRDASKPPKASKGNKLWKRPAPAEAPGGGEYSVFSSEQPEEDLGPQYGYRKSPFGHRDEVSVYTEQMDARYAMDPRARTLVILTVIVVLLVPAFTILPTGVLTVDGVRNGLAGYFDLFASNLDALSNWLSGVVDGNGLQVLFWQNLALVFVGAALAINGAVYQGAFKNALASPSTLGVMSGGTLGSVIYTLIWGVPVTDEMVTVTRMSEIIAEKNSMDTFEYILATQGRAFCSLAGCTIVVLLVLLIAYIAGRGKVSKVALVIAGQVFASVISGVVSVIRYYITYNGTDEQIAALQSTVGGSISNILGPLQFALVAVPIAIGLAVVMVLRFRMNLLAFSDEEAASMGISVARSRNLMVAMCTVMTAVVVSFCGNVGFVGFLIPHITRKLVGPDFKYLLPASALLGAIYLLISNHVMSLGDLLTGSLGTFTSIIGVVFFLIAAVQQRRRGNADWI